jgi:hypothetical protein
MQEDINYRPNLQPDQSIEIENNLVQESEYRQSLMALNRAGILSILPESERLGVVGIDGKEYPAPTWAEVQEVFENNQELAETKRAQGFTRLQLTPLAVPIPVLINRAEKVIVKHSKEGKIFQTKTNPTDPDTVARVDTNEPVLVWDTVNEAIKTNGIVYFPRQFDTNHHGNSKEQVIADPKVCAIPGWSIGLVEDMNVLPQQGNGKTTGGRKQLENNQSPRDFLKSLQGSQYNGESGWTYEDFLANFLTQLEQTNHVSHEWSENSALWMVGSYLPGSANVPSGDWNRGYGRLDVIAGDPGYRTGRWGVRSTVRLGI